LKVTELKLIEKHDICERINDELDNEENKTTKLEVRWKHCASALNTCRKEKEN